MSVIRRFLLRLRNVIAPGRAERELTRELESHLAIVEDEYRRRGLSDDEARRAARRSLGGVEQSKNLQRDARSFVWLDDLRRDTAYAMRTLARTPMFTAVVIIILGVTIGATTAIFSVVDHVLIRSLPLPHADRLVRLYESNATAKRLRESVSPAHAADWRRASTSLEFIALIGGTSVTLTGAAEPESLRPMSVGPEFFELTGVRPALGTIFEPTEYDTVANASLGPLTVREPITGQAAIILSNGLWLRQFGGDPHVVGRVVKLNDTPARVVGVMPAGFRFDQSPWGQADCWLPHVPSRMMVQRRFRQYDAIARLKPGVSIATAQAELTSIAANLAKEHPKDDGGWTIEVLPFKDSLIGETKPTLLILFGGGIAVLLIACANVANLLLTRAAGRSREVAVRMAIGAGRSRLVRQWLTESTLLALAGGAAGYVMSLWAVPALVANSPLQLPRIDNVVVDGRIFAITVALSLVTGLVCGLAPALGLRGISVAALRTTGALRDGPRHRWLRPVLLVTQIGLAIMLLVGAGLMARSLWAVYGLSLGFEPRNVLVFNVNLTGDVKYRDLDKYRDFMHEFTGRLRTQPAVVDAGVGGVPLQMMMTNSFFAEGRADEIDAHMNVPGSGYFESLRIPLHAGRYFTDDDDRKTAPVAIVNRAFARAAWGTPNVVNRRIRYDEKSPWITVVGVVDDIRVGGLETPPPPMVFIPYLQTTIATMPTVAVRTKGDPLALVPLVRDVVRSIEPAMPISRVASMDEKLSDAIAPRLFNAWLLGLFSAIALALAVIGIYGLISQTVGQRTAEIGIRMALGAGRLQIVQLVVGGSLIMMAVGLVLGLAGAAATTRSLGSMLYGVQPLDPITLAVVPAIFLAVAALAALAPARRATRVDPVVALRDN